MAGILIQLLPLVIGSIAMPTWILVVLLLLRSGRGLIVAVAFVAGVTAVRLLQGLVFGSLLNVSKDTPANSKLNTIVSTLLLVAGILMWATALKQLRTVDKPGGAISQWKTAIVELTPVRALGLGALLVLTSSRAWLFTLAAISIIEQSELSYVASVVTFLLYVLGAQALLLAPLIASKPLSAQLESTSQWLDGHSRTVVIAASLVVGSFFLWRGIIGLIS